MYDIVMNNRLYELVEEFDIGEYEGFLFVLLDDCPVCYNEFSNLSPFLYKYKISPVAISRSKVKLNNFGSNFKTCSYIIFPKIETRG
ncbi:hypothetical protein SAMN05421761_10122 [Belliella pelovolcani]|uniref:Uncharacterized protein n=1 Tax=Belliella pelovolcani TaxID=529505 RepID=A0A1N7JI38_9BACT|nr:hypothetical protein SAMN05421761_10122 [Belliella pelovolcani]